MLRLECFKQPRIHLVVYEMKCLIHFCETGWNDLGVPVETDNDVNDTDDDVVAAFNDDYDYINDNRESTRVIGDNGGSQKDD